MSGGQLVGLGGSTGKLLDLGMLAGLPVVSVGLLVVLAGHLVCLVV